ncbi:MAG: fibronectin type III domain-containing protein [Elusimicrobia bacterium]|nr:fibronectin type III domain-containing protein [Elusimicrobiota bacterium]
MHATTSRKAQGALIVAGLLFSSCAASAAILVGRANHTATLLPDNSNILVVGGQDGNGAATALTSVQLRDANNQGAYLDRAPLNVARTSHTASLLPNGDILVVGGNSGAGVRSTFEVYSPGFNCWSAVSGAVVNGGTGRHSHTATVLKDPVEGGKVLLCGGFDAAGNVQNTCDLYTPGAAMTPASCGLAPLGAYAAAPAMFVARAAHTATLLQDGRVFMTGGLAAPCVSNCANAQYTLTSEVYRPGAPGFFTAAHSLITARAFHTATAMGNGKLLIVGGVNNRDLESNRGFLTSTEIYDPQADSMVPAAAVGTEVAPVTVDLPTGKVTSISEVRLAQHTAYLDPGGDVQLYGGLGNVTTTYLLSGLSATLVPVSVPTFCFYAPAGNPPEPNPNCAAFGASPVPPQLLPEATFANNSTVTAPLKFTLVEPVSGVIETGQLLLKADIGPPFVPIKATFPDGSFLTLTDPDPLDYSVGVPLELAGTRVSCVNKVCGKIERDFIVPGLSGTVFFFPLSNATLGSQTISGGTSIAFDMTFGNLSNVNTPLGLTGGTIAPATNVTVNFSPIFAGAHISSGVILLKSGNIIEPSSFTVTITQAVGLIPVGTIVGPLGVTNFPVTWTDLQGTIAWAGADPAQTFASPVAVPEAPTVTVQFGNLTGDVTFVADQADLSITGEPVTLTAPKAVARIHSMMFGDNQAYNPKKNVWAFNPDGQGSRDQRFGHTTTQAPNSDVFHIGGLGCPDNPNDSQSICGGPLGVGVARSTVTETESGFVTIFKDPANFNGTGSMGAARANHTSTLLPDGTILLAGGNQGPSVLNSAEIFDPAARAFSFTSLMNAPRDLHSATLLANGRVLVAGGFTTDAVSTGATKTAEIYYPDRRVWIPANPMTTERDQHTAVLLGDGRVIVAGGYANGKYLDSIELYNPITGIWTRGAHMSVARSHHTANLLQDGRVLVTLGISTVGVLNTFEIYNPDTDAWTAPATVTIPPPPAVPVNTFALHSHRTTMLLNGRVLLSGGDNGFGETDTSLLFDPVSLSWSSTTSHLNHPRLAHSALLVPNGQVWAIGGVTANLQSIKKTEFFDPSSGFWVDTADLTTSRGYETATVAQDGDIVVAGGLDSGQPLKSVEDIPFGGTYDLDSVGSPPAIRQSSITAVDLSPFDRGNFVTLNGFYFQGLTEASGGGAGSANSSFYNPRIYLQAVDGSGGASSQGSGGFALDLSTQIYANAFNSWTKTDSSISIQMPAYAGVLPAPAGGTYLPYGWYQMRLASNAVFSKSRMVQAGPPKPTGSPAPVVGNLATITTSSVTWTWSAVPFAQGYDIFNATTGVIISTSDPATLTTQTQNLSPNTPIEIAVGAFALSGDGPLAYSATFFTLAVPPIVTAGNISSVTFNSVRLEWSVNGNSKGTVYEVSASTDNPLPGGNGQAPFTTSFSTPIPTVVADTTNFAIINFLASNTTYSFRVQAYNGAGIPSGFSAIVTTRTRTSVNGVVGTAQDTTSILWTWMNTLPPLNLSAGEHFNVYNATSGVLLASTGNPTYLDVVAATNTPRQVSVSAVTSAGEGPLTPSATVFTLSAVPALINPPVSPSSISTGSFIVVWGANGNPLGTVYSPLVVGLGGAQVPAAFGQTTGFFAGASGLTPPTGVYQLSVQSQNGDGILSQPLNLGTTETFAAPPVNLAVTNNNSNTVTLNWSSNNNGSSATYEVTYTTDNFVGSVFYSVPFSLGSQITTVTVTGLITGTTYSFRVQARNLFGVPTAFSNIVTTSPFNGGVPLGQIGGFILPGQNNQISGTIAGPPQRFVSLMVPIGSLPPGTFVTISSLTVPPSPCGPNGLSIGVSIITNPPVQPAGPVFLTIGYTGAEVLGLDLGQVALQRVDLTGACVPLVTTFDTADNTLTAQLNHFTAFQAGTVLASASPDSTLIFPNPFYPSRGQGYVTFARMPAYAHVRLYSMRGELVAEDNANGSGLLIWGGINKSGRSVASGVYMAVVEAGDSKKIFKVVVLR